MLRELLLDRLDYYRCVNDARYRWPARQLLVHWWLHRRQRNRGVIDG